MKTSSDVIALPSARPDLAQSYSASDSGIAQAISRAQENLLRQQRPDGHWCGELMVDSTLCSDYVLFMHWCGDVDPQLQQRCVRHIVRRQLPDGGWNIYYGGPSEVNASVKAYFALTLAGCSADAPFMRHARAKFLHPLRLRPMRRRALEEAERCMLERIGEGSDGLATVFPAMLNCLIALRALGYSKKNPVYVKAEKDFAGLFVDDSEDFRIQPCFSPVWDTAINIIALAESGASPEHPALQKAAEWLVKKEVRMRGDWTVNNPHPEASGWAFEYNNVYYPDTDDTAMVLMALRLVRPQDRHSLEELFRRAIGWQLSFQCKDGGWAAFDKNVTTQWLEDVPFADHNAILDPTCSDLTERTLELFGYIDFDPNHPSVRHALKYLIETQEDDGSWYGRWGVNYTYGTWQVLRGLRAIGQDMTQDWILRGRDWLEG